MDRKIFKTGHSLAVTISKDLLKKLDLKEGDKVNIIFDEDSSKLTIAKSKGRAQMDLGFKFRHCLGEPLTKK